MKLIDMKCPSCGAKLKNTYDGEMMKCPYCNSEFKIDMETKKVEFVNVEKYGYEFEKGRMRAHKESSALFKVCLGVTLVVLCIVVGIAYVTRMTKSSIVSDVLENNEGLERSLNNNQQLNQITVNKNNLFPDLYTKDDTNIKIGECSYTKDASDIKIELNIDNNTGQIIEIEFSNIVIDNANMKMAIRNWDEIQVGSWCDNFYISLEDMQRAGVSDFSQMECNITGKEKDGKILFEKNVIFKRECFSSSEKDGNDINFDQSVETAEQDSENIVVNKKNLKPVLYKYNDTEIGIEECKYIKDASDVSIDLNIDNYSGKIIRLEFQDIQVDGASLQMKWNFSEYKIGSVGSYYYISLEDLEKVGVSDFKKINAIVKITTKDGEVLAQRSLVIEREAFE